ncbi:hypothetical protein N9L68_07000 [bacterium]|nr:hypothetical protein [bacterium]
MSASSPFGVAAMSRPLVPVTSLAVSDNDGPPCVAGATHEPPMVKASSVGKAKTKLTSNRLAKAKANTKSKHEVKAKPKYESATAPATRPATGDLAHVGEQPPATDGSATASATQPATENQASVGQPPPAADG